MRLSILYTIILAILFIPIVAFGSTTEQGRGMLFGEHHAFFVTAAPGWLLDNQSGVGQGLHMVFYPVGRTWADSPVIIYGMSVSKSITPDVESQVTKTVEDFHDNGNPDYKGVKNSTLTLPDETKADIYYFTGDQWGNYEAVAYFDEKDTINFLVFNSGSKEEFEKYLTDFRETTKTYRNVYTNPSTVEKNEVDQLILETENHLKRPGGKEYETKVIQASGQMMADFMKDCTSYLSPDNLPPFHLFQRIKGDGSILESIIYPSTSISVCFKGLMSGIKYPRHDFDNFLLDLSMSVAE